MKLSFLKGVSYGITSAVITTLGLMIGLVASTNSRIVVIGGILIIAIADAMSDALGVHISEESEDQHSQREIWESTFATFFTKAAISLTFIVPIAVLALSKAIYINIAWGLFLITTLSYYIASKQKAKVSHVVAEHLAIAIAVILIAHYIGHYIAAVFG